ncbi:hypothetical protein B0T10DRAFT_590133 [Thelonectria olida]|uniref:Uncharacterized protein n=1 Tax=Thelonectria olida TaxID=1576542 RepID=A0A9P9AT36_9HYPO|nr:hypothetical protein B0T10DRAFT_590133 [Thelonectria olida]
MPFGYLVEKAGKKAARKLYHAATRGQVKQRLLQDSDTTRGERVWFSHHTWNGQLKHWALITHGYKYELRAANPNLRAIENGDRIRDGWTSVGGWGRRYQYNISPCRVDEEKRRAAIKNSRSPEVDGFYVSMIGWTNKTKAEVDAACIATAAKFGFYNLFFNNCQHFLRTFAVEIVDDKAQDWAWFANSTASSYRYVHSGPIGALYPLLSEGAMNGEAKLETVKRLLEWL